MYQHEFLATTSLPGKGLNLQFVVDIDSLPAEIVANLRQHCAQLSDFRQLILIGHGGGLLWQKVNEAGMDSDHPIDNYSATAVDALFAESLPDHHYQILFPGEGTLQLQTLGKLAGWHHSSPLRIGINDYWGTWFAYRAVVVADTRLAPSKTVSSHSPCLSCKDKPCISHCPAKALTDEKLNLDACIQHRLQAGSDCKNQCLARLSCPVAAEHRYSDEQIHYHYGISMRTIEDYLG